MYDWLVFVYGTEEYREDAPTRWQAIKQAVHRHREATGDTQLVQVMVALSSAYKLNSRGKRPEGYVR